MNHQLNTDARIDQVLTALRTTDPPAGLEQRIASRLAQAAEERALSTSAFVAASSYFAIIQNAVKAHHSSFAPARRRVVAATAVALLIALTTFTILRPHRVTNTAQTNFNSHANPLARSQVGNSSLDAVPPNSRHTTYPGKPASASDGIYRTAATQVPRGFSLGFHSPSTTAGVLTPASAPPDLDAIALAETLTPSHPAPPLPLTAQEKLIEAATRPGQPIQLAELDLARAPNLRAATQAREHSSLESYVKALLAPFAVADALQPTTQSQPQEAPASPPAEPTANPSN